MSAIAGSDVEPTKIFQIIADSKEYKFVGREMQKVINQMELYGADLVVALKNIARTTLNSRLAELLNGMATNVSTGASLKNYLEKKSETMLIDYRLERERYNSLAANFMDIYISVLITAPLILIIIIVIMNVANLNFMQLSTSFLVGISLAILILANIAFLIFLKIKQPPI
jgi:flagellar protein FlaJ